MAKKEENGRDIFDKALDYAPIAGGAVGALLGRRAFRRAVKRERLGGTAAEINSAGRHGFIAGATPGAVAGFIPGAVRDDYDNYRKKKKSRKK